MNLIFASGFVLPQRLFVIDYFRALAGRYPQALFSRCARVRRVIATRCGVSFLAWPLGHKTISEVRIGGVMRQMSQVEQPVGPATALTHLARCFERSRPELAPARVVNLRSSTRIGIVLSLPRSGEVRVGSSKMNFAERYFIDHIEVEMFKGPLRRKAGFPLGTRGGR